ncbi:MAG TPA: MotA/TolQ/ExbB proton channel family protein [Candidatus Krumholzibacteria bacterium]|nr:MotA/TolQ/ExbB proton channel family protein [Candidatus Krumholzibacteria bacterium]HRX50328.1 MotA/TolQ/ExbB proton channel family protein [Candidatus Krumholzibacteria bacterium]
MARLGTIKKAILALFCLGLLSGLALAQEEGTGPNVEAIMAPTDSLAFGSTLADSASEVPVVIEERGGLMGWVERSPFGQSGAGELFVKGGNFMWWLLIVAVMGLVFMIERFWTLNRARVNTRKLIGTVITTLRNDGVQAAAEECQKVRGPIAAILNSGLQKVDRGPDAVEKSITTAGTIEMAFLERGLIWVSSVSTIAPLIGFLGTVSGMINAFEAIASSDSVNAQLVAAGISEALITTATGLVIAIPTSIAFNYFVSTIDRFVIEMEEASSELIDELQRQKYGV